MNESTRGAHRVEKEGLKGKKIDGNEEGKGRGWRKEDESSSRENKREWNDENVILSTVLWSGN